MKTHWVSNLCLHCFLRQKQSKETEIQFYLKIITCDPSVYTIDHPKFIISNQNESSTCILPEGVFALNLFSG